MVKTGSFTGICDLQLHYYPLYATASSGVKKEYISVSEDHAIFVNHDMQPFRNTSSSLFLSSNSGILSFWQYQNIEVYKIYKIYFI